MRTSQHDFKLSSLISHLSYLKRERFTLIELLIVIAIIAILAGMLLPSLSKAKERGYGLQCVSNIKQLGSVYLMYGTDNRDILPCKDNLPWVGADWLNGVVEDYLKRANASTSPVEVLFCPNQADKAGITTTYGLNYLIATVKRDNVSYGIPTTTHKQPSGTGLLVENTGHLCYYCDVENSAHTFNAGSPAVNRAAFFRHLEKASTAFLDGHAEALGKKNLPCRESFSSASKAALENTVFNMGKKVDGDTVDYTM